MGAGRMMLFGAWWSRGWLAVVVVVVTGCSPETGEANPSANHTQPPSASAVGVRPQSGEGPSGIVQEAASATSFQIDEGRITAIVRAAERVAPAVVSISVIRSQLVRPRSAYESRFMAPGTRQRTAGFGSGVIVREDGIVLTNDHVIEDAEQIRVTLPDGRDFDAELIGTDARSDIAVLRIRGDNLPVAPVGTVRGLMIGEWALAIGNPLGNYVADTEPTVTAGVVSAVNRNIQPTSEGEGFYLGMIQTDASINPGNSGGALVNAAGEVIGINASIVTRSGGSEGLGFAIPIDRALRIADDLVRTGEVPRAWVGLDVEPVEADPWGRTRGVRVARVVPDSPGAGVALKRGDRLLTANGRALAGTLDFEGVLLDLRSGDELLLEVEGQPRPVRLTAGAFPTVTAERVTVLRDMQVITVTPQVRAERRLASETGALVTAISEQLSGALGLTVGDVILRINRSGIGTAEDVALVFEALRGTGRVPLWYERNGGQYVREFYWRR
jgi:serine protease Do